MKRNIVPLLGIAVVVAILSTAVFYGLFAGKLRSASPELNGHPIVVAARDLDRGAVLKADDLKMSQFRETLTGSFSSFDQLSGATLIAPIKQNEPVLEERVVATAGKTGLPGGPVPAGEQAVSIRISESDGLVGLLRPGARVDLQAIEDKNGSTELRTILQNVEVLSVNPQAQAAGARGSVSVVTVLTRPDDVDLLALADSGARLRLSLRNPLDQDAAPRRALALASVFQGNSSRPVVPVAVSPSSSPSVGAAPPVQLDLHVLRATPEAMRQLESKLEHPIAGNSIGVVPFAAGLDARELIEKLAAEHAIEILTEQTLTASRARPARFRAGAASGRLGVVFFVGGGSDRKLNLRVQPEISSQSKSGMETRLFDATVPAAGSLLIGGLLNQPGDRERLEQLYPGHSWTDGRLAIVIHTSEDRPLSAARGRQGR
ncbi:MAG TPA: Flp pilus assembly protein CpaB [Bryobacteraceae bacterium]|nr:Flp pilus assembly protein CpaB [Bryobacteraceae bacterium]